MDYKKVYKLSQKSQIFFQIIQLTITEQNFKAFGLILWQFQCPLLLKTPIQSNGAAVQSHGLLKFNPPNISVRRTSPLVFFSLVLNSPCISIHTILPSYPRPPSWAASIQSCCQDLYWHPRVLHPLRVRGPSKSHDAYMLRQSWGSV